MKRMNYYIRVNSNTKPERKTDIRKGYIFEYDGYFFGITKEYSSWIITELTTGYKAAECYRLKDKENAIQETYNRITKDKFNEYVERYTAANNYKSLNPHIVEIWTAKNNIK